ncbi:hypothetical protein [Desertivirga xinjiangensis]|uniref:hypothetical protein n=1 Tax=Desertivirga xinjiangensis TaxID=539206 RepID=UPI00210DFE4C|nr:hypothetical protein [Pedobacter xinjiangensis]
MKRTMMMAVASLLLCFTACQKSAGENGSEGGQYITKDPKTGDGFVMLTEKKLFNEVKLSAGEDRGKAFDIEKISREGNILVVKVIYSAACSAPSFDVIWDGRVMMTYPYKVDLVLKMNADKCSEDQQKLSKEIKIDLNEYVGDFASDKATVFSVINASSKKEKSYNPSSNY